MTVSHDVLFIKHTNNLGQIFQEMAQFSPQTDKGYSLLLPQFSDCVLQRLVQGSRKKKEWFCSPEESLMSAMEEWKQEIVTYGKICLPAVQTQMKEKKVSRDETELQHSEMIAT